MAGGSTRDIILGIVAIAAVIAAAYMIVPTMGGLLRSKDGFTGTLSYAANGNQPPDFPGGSGQANRAAVMANPNVSPGPQNLVGYEGPASFGNAEKPEGCYPRDQLTPGELLPKDPNSIWAQQNPMGTGSLKGKNFLSAGALIGINTVGQTLRNANYQLRSEPPNPQVPVSAFNNPTIEPDVNRRSLEIG
jgi:hypothetical protein